MLEQFDSNNKRIFTKNKSQIEMTKNQKISTNDSEEATTLKPILKKQKTLSNLSQLGIPTNASKNINKYKTESIQTILPKKKKNQNKLIKYDTNELKKKINEINSQINNEKTISINNYNKLNKEIIEKIGIIKNLAEEQRKLIAKLKIMKDEINNKIERVNRIALKNGEYNKKEKIVQKLIIVKEKEIEMANKKTALIKKECFRAKNILNNNDFIKENNLRKEYSELKNEILKLEHDKRKLETILDQHQYCDKRKNELLNYLSLLTNAYQFEIKKSSLIMTINSDSNNFEEIKNKSNNDKKIFLSPKTKSTKNIFIPKTDKKLVKKDSYLNLISKSASDYIHKILNNVKEENKKDQGIISNSNNFNYKTKKKNLFNLKENFFLEKIIPNNYLIKCKERFDNIENNNCQLKEKISLYKMEREKFMNEKQMEIEFKEIKIKSAKKEELRLNINIYKTSKKIEELKKEINKLNKETKKVNNIIIIKKKENSNVNNKMKELKKDIKKRKKEMKENKDTKEEIINNKEEIYITKISQKEELKEVNQKNNIYIHPKKKIK